MQFQAEPVCYTDPVVLAVSHHCMVLAFQDGPFHHNQVVAWYCDLDGHQPVVGCFVEVIVYQMAQQLELELHVSV